MGKTVVVAMSGGVDSSVAALLLKKAGYTVVGVTMRLWSEYREDLPVLNRHCCTLDDVDDARRVCQVLGVPHYVLNFEKEFRIWVIDYFCQEYQNGRTPYPCLACNDRLKFDFLLQRARAFGADYLATGHYARRGEAGGQYILSKASDSWKDQSYVLFQLGQGELGRVLFPVGDHAKAEIRRIAAEGRLPVADKPDSQEICFVAGGSYKDFIAERYPPRAGEIVDTQGRVLGKHMGIHNFTIGQRHGLGIRTDGKPYFVVRLEPQEARVVVGGNEDLLSSALLAESVTYVSGQEPEGPVQVRAKVRYRSPEVEAWLSPRGELAEVRFVVPQRAITPGQAVVFYEGERVLGGGIIREAAL